LLFWNINGLIATRMVYRWWANCNDPIFDRKKRDKLGADANGSVADLRRATSDPDLLLDYGTLKQGGDIGGDDGDVAEIPKSLNGGPRNRKSATITTTAKSRASTADSRAPTTKVTSRAPTAKSRAPAVPASRAQTATDSRKHI
jgi:hypothetical protein